MAQDNREKLAEAVRLIFGALSDDHAEQFESLCTDAGLCWQCGCGDCSPDGEACGTCGKPQPYEGQEPDDDAA